MTSHDQLFKDLFRTFFQELLLLVDAGLAACLSPEAVFLDKELFLDLPEGKRREADLLVEVPERAGGRKLLIHVEIEHRARAGIGRRLWRYFLQLHLRHSGPVVSLVVFLHGGPPGSRWAVHVERLDERELVRFSYLSFGISRLPAEALLERPEPLAWALAALARPGALGRARLKLELLRKIAEAPVGEAEQFLLTNCVETYLQLSGRDVEEFSSLRRALHEPEVEVMQTTWADRMEAEAYERAYDKAYDKVYDKAYEEAYEKAYEKACETVSEEANRAGVDRVRSTVLRQLGQRFGKVSPKLRKRLEAMHSLDELVAVADRILEVQSVGELNLGS